MEIISGIHEIKTKVSRCYLIIGDEITLVDTGMSGNSKKIINYLKNILNHNPTDIKTIVLTHHHYDHVGSLDKLKDITGAKIAIHPNDADYISGKKNHNGPTFVNMMVKLLKILYRTQNVEPDILLQDGDIIGEYRVIHTPGHTPGSICLYNSKNKAIFVGDNLQYSNGNIKSPGARLLPEPEQYKESMKKLGDLDIEVILTGHTSPVTSHANKKLDEFLDQISNEI